ALGSSSAAGAGSSNESEKAGCPNGSVTSKPSSNASVGSSGSSTVALDVWIGIRSSDPNAGPRAGSSSSSSFRPNDGTGMASPSSSSSSSASASGKSKSMNSSAAS